MKKLVSIIATLLGLFILLVLFSACSDEAVSSPGSSITISEGELTEREEFLLSSLTEHIFIYDFVIEDGPEDLVLYVEEFVYGERQEYPVSSISLEEIDANGSLFFAINRPDIESDERSFILGVESDGNWSTVTSLVSMTTEEDELAATLWQNTAADGNDLTVSEGGTVLASIIHADGEKGMSTLSDEFYHDVEGNLEVIEAYPSVYLFKVDYYDSENME